MQISHELLMAGLRDQIGADGDLQQACQNWQVRRRESKRRAYEKAAQLRRERQTGTETAREDDDVA